MSRVRPFHRRDLSQVAQLFLRVFPHEATRLPIDDVMRNLAEVFLDHPWPRECLSSLVCEATAGRVIAFLGVTPRRMRFRRRPILAAVSAHLMVAPDHRATLAAIELQKAFFAGPQDLSLTDSATDQGRAVWTGLGGAMVAIPSVSWLRPLRPATLWASAALSKYRWLAPLTSAVRACSPAADVLMARRWPARFRVTASRGAASALDTDTVLSGISSLSALDAIWPEYDAQSMNWLLGRAHRIRTPGTLRTAAFRNDARKILGWYLYYLKPGGVCEVLQVVANEHVIGDVFDHLSHDAWSRGATGLAGRMELPLMETLGAKKCILTCGNPWVLAHARDPELLRAAAQGRVFLTRLDGEWCTSVRN